MKRKPWIPYLSIIMPVWNGAGILEKSLASIRANSFRDYELIVVDDGSSDRSPEIIRRFQPDVVLRNTRTLDADASRNLGARQARGEVLVFVDQDVVVRPDTLERAARWFQTRKADCLIGVYSLEHPHRNLCSIYKNTWVRYTYLRRFPRPGWFWTGLGAVRRRLFINQGGFCTQYTTTGAGADFDFGFRLQRRGLRIVGDPELEVIHLKHYGLWKLLVNDFRRARGLTGAALRSGKNLMGLAGQGVGNIPVHYGLGVLLSWGIVNTGALALVLPGLQLPLLALALAYATLLSPFHHYLTRNFSLGFSLRCLPVSFLDHLASGLGMVARLQK